MPYDPQEHHRHSIRLKGYNYAQPGAYFVTIVTQGRECLFGEIVEGVMRLNDAGRMVGKWWLELKHKFPPVATDEYAIMPNHFHGIVVIVAPDGHTPPDANVRTDVGAGLRVGPNGDARIAPGTHAASGGHVGAPLRVGPADLGAHVGAPLPTIMQWFKTMTTNEYIRGVKQWGWPPFPGKLWQRNYYEHVVRNETDLTRIRAYIANNPRAWASDHVNPTANGEER